MKLLIFGPRERYTLYRPAGLSLPVEPVFIPEGLSPREAALLHPDAGAIFTDTCFDFTPQVMDLLPHLRLIHSEGAALLCI